MLRRWVVESLDGTGRVMFAVSVFMGLLAGLASSHFLRITDEQWTNIGSLALIGGAAGFFVYLFFLAPFRLWYRAEKELERCQQQEEGAPIAVHHGKGNQIINNFYGLDAAQMKSVVLGTSSGGPGGVAIYAPLPSSQTLVVPSHRPRGHAEVATPQLSLPLLPPSEPRLPGPEESGEHSR